MTPRQILFVTIVAVVFLLVVVELVRRRLLLERYSLLWFAIGILLITVPWLYDAYLFLARLAGIVYPASLFFFAAIVGLCLLCLQFSLALSSACNQRKTLIQQVGLLEHRLYHVEEVLSTRSQTRGHTVRCWHEDDS